MEKLIYLLIFFSCTVNADQLSDQLKAFDTVEQQNISAQNAKDQAEYKAQQAEQKRKENLAIEQSNANRRLQEKAIQANVEANKAADARAKDAANKRAAQENAENAERLKDKTRIQAAEDEEHELEIAAKKAELLQLQAISGAKAKRANELLDAELAHEKATTDVVQSTADATRNISEGNKELQIGMGKGFEGQGKTWIIVLLWILAGLVLIAAIAVAVIFYLKHKRSKEDAIKESDRSQ